MTTVRPGPIRCLINHLSTGANGRPLRREQRVSAAEISLGRGAACEIHLPDSRIGLRHAVVRRDDLGALIIVAEGDALLSCDGFMDREASLSPGRVIGIGPYRITVGTAGEGIHLALDIAAPQGDAPQSAGHAADLPSGQRFSKRGVGVALALLILMLGFLLPLSARFSPAVEARLADLPGTPARWLSPGELDAAHTRIGAQCSQCHKAAFQAVGDSACGECHRDTKRHWPADHASAPVEGHRCIDCHAMHAGKAAARHGDARACTACHAGLPGDGELRLIRNFEHDHPEFRLSLLRGKQVERISQSGALPPERSGLIFPHKLHLAAKGVSSPEGDTVLTCRDCHRPDAAGEGFQPVDMEQGCQQSRCHTQRFAEPILGVIKHGSERLPVDHLRRVFLERIAPLAGAELKAECGPASSGTGPAEHARQCAERKALEFAARNVFHTTGEGLQCGLCHGIRRTESKLTPWRVEPVRITRDWHAKARFPHRQHATQPCTDCHRKQESESADDIAIPGIKTCRECHADQAEPGRRVATTCANCHRYHRQSP